jgi:hypothetical protein
MRNEQTGMADLLARQSREKGWGFYRHREDEEGIIALVCTTSDS